MGLDITHMKLSLIKTDTTEMYLKDEIMLGMKDVNNFPDDIYSEKLVNGFWEFIAIFKNNEELEFAKPELERLNDGYRNFKMIVSKTDNQFKEKINHFEKEHKIEKVKKTKSLIEVNLKNGSKILFESLCYEGELNCKVAYFQEVGYQRKGMGNGFSNYFKNDSFYSELKNFEKLLDFYSRNNHMYEEGNIKNNFIKNYVKGESLMMISW